MRRILLITAGILLGCAVAFTLYGQFRPLHRTFYGPVKNLLPSGSDPMGWRVEFLPVAQTPELQKKVDELLNYDDAVYAVYTRGRDHFSVYAAYWAPGRMSPRLVAGHTPDVCWIGDGWTISRRTPNVQLRRDGATSLPLAQQRIMTKNGRTEHVVFWHLLDGHPQTYDGEGAPPWYAFATELWQRGLDLRQEQFFIRISSNLPVEDWPEAEIYGQIVERLPPPSAGSVEADRP